MDRIWLLVAGSTGVTVRMAFESGEQQPQEVPQHARPPLVPRPRRPTESLPPVTPGVSP
jgi:hypothetical protein